MMKKYSDPEEWEADCGIADKGLSNTGRKVVVIFDALDGIALDWERLRHLTDVLLEVAWSIADTGACVQNYFLGLIRCATWAFGLSNFPNW